MNNNVPELNLKDNTYHLKGDWIIIVCEALWQQIEKLEIPSTTQTILDAKDLTKLDSAGTLTLLKLIDKLHDQNKDIEFINFTDEKLALIKLIDSKRAKEPISKPQKAKQSLIPFIGKQTIDKINQVDGLLTLVGDFSEKVFLAFSDVRKFQMPSISANVYNAGITALPIIGLLSFLIGIVLAYQLGLQLKNYGAHSFIAYLSGMTIFREFGPLITAIIVAGRTGSSFTAQIGIMKINEEIDALRTMGLSPTILLVTPKVLGLVIIFPLLIFWADVFGIIGSMIMSKSILNVGYYEFLTRLQNSVGFKQLMLGVYKAPAFAILIALVGCFQGFRVQYNAQSLGIHTTKSVVQSIFLIIVADAIYTVIYSWMDL